MINHYFMVPRYLRPNEYWHQNVNKIDQKFYSGFCILQSSIADYVLTCGLKSRNCLNWAVTSNYYSIVHLARLLCFLTMGDFPKRHSILYKLFKGGDSVTDWLKDFVNTTEIKIKNDEPLKFSYLLNYCQSIPFLDPEDQLKKLGNILETAGICRNDSNYEMLIMAHEFRHKLISPAFNSLSNVLQNQAEALIPTYILAFKHFIDSNDGTRFDRAEYWYSYLNWEGNDGKEGLKNFMNFLNYRFDMDRNITDEKVIDQITKWLKPLNNKVDEEYAEEVYSSIRMDIFDLKAKKMIKFNDNIRKLNELN